MPKCSKCGDSHAPPRGKKCQAQPVNPVSTTPDECIARLTDAVTALGDRIARLETPTSPSQRSPPASPNIVSQTRERLHDLGLMDVASGDEDSDATDDDDKTLKPNKGKRSGKLRTVAHRVKYEVDWPHFYVYRHDAPASYDTLSIAEFTFGYMSMLENASISNKQHMQRHFKDLMEDAMSYKWETVRAYHAVVLSHIETGRLEWSQACDECLRRRHVWSRAQEKRTPKNNQTDRSKTVCLAFQTGACDYLNAHDQKLHVCSYCYKSGGHFYSHPEKNCRRKEYNQKNSKVEGQ